MKTAAIFLTTLLFASNVALAGENAAPSSHMVYNDANIAGDIIINEVRVPVGGEAMYTYYEALGWGGKAAGYAGIQSHPKGHNYIFSIWDHKAHSAPIKALYRGKGTLTEKFGGEGTGLKSWNFQLGWETGVWYTLAARCWPVGDHTHCGYWVQSQQTGQWTHLVTMDVAAKNAWFNGGNDSFIEDWLETGKAARTSNLRNGWKRHPDGDWHAFGSARYSVNSWDLTPGKRSYNFRTNWNGGVAKDTTGEFYFMTAGGSETKPTTANPSTHSIKRLEKKPGYAPIKILSAGLSPTTPGKYLASWKIAPDHLPQFQFTISAYDNDAGRGKPLFVLQKVEPHARAVELALPKDLPFDQLHWRIECRDILGNASPALPFSLSQ